MSWTNSYSLEQTGAFLRQVRKERGLTQEQFARKLGVSHATLSALENGEGVSAATLERAWQLLDLRLVIVPKNAQVHVVERGQEGWSPMTGSSTLAVCLHNKRIGTLRGLQWRSLFVYCSGSSGGLGHACGIVRD